MICKSKVGLIVIFGFIDHLMVVVLWCWSRFCCKVCLSWPEVLPPVATLVHSGMESHFCDFKPAKFSSYWFNLVLIQMPFKNVKGKFLEYLEVRLMILFHLLSLKVIWHLELWYYGFKDTLKIFEHVRNWGHFKMDVASSIVYLLIFLWKAVIKSTLHSTMDGIL